MTDVLESLFAGVTHTLQHVVGMRILYVAFVFAVLFLVLRMVRAMREGRAFDSSLLNPHRGVSRSVAQNILLAFLNSLPFNALFGGVFIVLDGVWAKGLGLEPVPVLSTAPIWVAVPALLLLMDFTNYWSHRLLHTSWQWPVHSLHHSDVHMNATTASRIHFLEAIQMALVALAITGWMELPTAAGALAVLIRVNWSAYTHSGLKLDHGRFRKWLVSPNYHSWHHADDPEVYGKNLADMFPLWDLAFGTHHDPGWCDIPMGVSDVPDDVIEGQLHPFRRLLATVKAKAKRPASV